MWAKVFWQTNWHVTLAAILAALATAAVCAEIVTAIVRRVLAPGGGADRRQNARTTIRAVRLLLLVLLTVVFVPPALDLLGAPPRAGLRFGVLVDWLLGSGLKILFISTFAYVLIRVIALTTTRFERHLNDQQAPASEEYARRARTLGNMTRNVTTMLIVAIAAVYVLKELNFDPLPLLTGAGIAGLAIGFGAQTLVKDVISGFFLIFENQLRVGDIAEINGTGGLVEAIHLRTILLRDQRGAVHVFPCGSINSLANLTKDFAYAVLNVRVHYRHDIDQVIGVLRQVGASLRDAPEFRDSIFAPLEVLGVENLGTSGVTILVRMKTLPLRQFDVARELRRRIKKAFDDAGIEIPVAPAAPASP